MRDEQDFYIGQCDGADKLDAEAVVVDLPALPGRDTRLREALAVVEAHERAPIIVALDRWIKRRAGCDDQFYPTLRQLRFQVQCLKLAATANQLRADPLGCAPKSYATDAAALRVLLGALTGGMYTDADLSVLDDDEGLDDDTDDEGLDDDGPDSNPCPRPPECDWCGGKGCDTCCDPNYAGVDP